jgi:hypothetical protein
MENTFDIAKARKAQENYCNEKKLPHFAPASGICYRCCKNIYEEVGWKVENGRKIQVPLKSVELHHKTGVTVEEAGKTLITGCPHCNRSYCD